MVNGLQSICQNYYKFNRIITIYICLSVWNSLIDKYPIPGKSQNNYYFFGVLFLYPELNVVDQIRSCVMKVLIYFISSKRLERTIEVTRSSVLFILIFISSNCWLDRVSKDLRNSSKILSFFK